MTDPDLADATYIEPITPEIVAKIIETRTPRCAASDHGRTDRAQLRAVAAQDGRAGKIQRQDDRRHRRRHRQGGGPRAVPQGHDERSACRRRARTRSRPCRRRWKRSTISACRRSSARRSRSAAPAAVSPTTRPSSSTSSKRGIDASPTNEVLIEESVLGWKEFEMEVVRDKKDNCIIICSIENVDPMGVHTGDSITIAPALTLTDKEYQILRDASIAVLREIGVETGGSNVQFAINPVDGRLVVIEMNPRVSRSSALASKATGFPDRQGRGQARRRLHARRNRQRHHRRRDARLVRADHRLRRHQDPALRLREISRRLARAHHLDEIGGRSDGDRPHLPGEPAEGAALAGNRPHRPRRDDDRRLRRRQRHRRHRQQGRDPRRARHADAGPAAQGGAGHAARRRPTN